MGESSPKKEQAQRQPKHLCELWKTVQEQELQQINKKKLKNNNNKSKRETTKTRDWTEVAEVERKLRNRFDEQKTESFKEISWRATIVHESCTISARFLHYSGNYEIGHLGLQFLK